MAMIPCPDCGQEVSDKAKKCIHCGKILIEEIIPKKFCAECGQEIPSETQECPFCGCPVEPEKVENTTIAKVSDKITKHKKPIIIITVIIIIAIIASLIVNFTGSLLNEDEQLAYQNAVEMNSMMKDPDSFKLYDEMFLLKHYDENGENDFTYTIFKYGGANGYGAITTDEAIFKDGEFIMNYADEADEDDANYVDQLFAKVHIAGYMLTGDDDTMKMIDIDIEKIKNKMGLE